MAFHWQGQFADGLGETSGICDQLRWVVTLGDDFHQGHFRHRVEKMQADESGRVPQFFSQLFQWNTGCIGSQQGGVFHPGFYAVVKILLGIDILKDGFDDHIGFFNPVTEMIGKQTIHGALYQIPILELFLEQCVSAADRTTKVFRCPVLQADVQPAQYAPGGDVASHHTTANDMHMSCLEAAVLRKSLETIL